MMYGSELDPCRRELRNALGSEWERIDPCMIGTRRVYVFVTPDLYQAGVDLILRHADDWDLRSRHAVMDPSHFKAYRSALARLKSSANVYIKRQTICEVSAEEVRPTGEDDTRLLDQETRAEREKDWQSQHAQTSDGERLQIPAGEQDQGILAGPEPSAFAPPARVTPTEHQRIWARTNSAAAQGAPVARKAAAALTEDARNLAPRTTPTIPPYPMVEMRAVFADSGQNMDPVSANTAITVYECSRKWYCSAAAGGAQRR